MWIPKYRHKVFGEPYRTVVKDVIRKIGYDYDIDIVELEVPANHIHMVVRSEPKASPSSIMQIIKGISAREFFRLHPEVKKNIFGEVNYELKAMLLKRLVMLVKK